MGAILGTVAGWERDPRWTPGYRIYTGPAYIKYEVPPERIPPENRHEYRVRLDITVYLCDTPDLTYPIVIREITGILMVSIYEEEYPGGLEQWISDISIREAEELLARSNVEVAGLVPCEKGYDVRIYDGQYIPPISVEIPVAPPVPVEVKIPEYIRAAIRVTLERIKQNLDDPDYVKQLIRDLDSILERNDLTREDIKDLVKEQDLEHIVKI